MERSRREDKVFMVSEVALILGMPEARLKNWTIGRPLLIQPAMAAYGTGTRNLYCVGDIYRMAIANQMSASGATPRAIQSVLDELGTSFSSCIFVVLQGPPLGMSGDKTEIQLIHHLDHLRDGWKKLMGESAENSGCRQLINVRAIAVTVDSLVDRFIEKHRRPASSGQIGKGRRKLESKRLDNSAISAHPTRKMRGF